MHSHAGFGNDAAESLKNSGEFVSAERDMEDLPDNAQYDYIDQGREE